MSSFSDFGLLTSLLKSLKDQRLSKPTEIQTNIIPLLMSGQSAVGVSETGSGKTLAYSLPILQLLKTIENEGQPVTEEASPRAVIMVPTRELGEQVSKVFKTFTHDTRLRVRTALGGMAMEQVMRNIASPFEILLGTPGRISQLIQADKINLKDVRFLVFDEADQMMDQGFLTDSNLIVDVCPQDVQLALFSATVSPSVQQLLNTMFAKAEIVRTARAGKTVPTLVTKNMTVIDGQRWPVMEKLLAQKTEGGTILFTNTREQCDKLAALLKEHGHECVVYRGEMEPNDRRKSLKAFRDGKVELMVATDIAGRGLDVPHVGRVINYHLPKQMDNYTHRAGRTARAGRKGTVVNLVTERDEYLIARIEGKKNPSSVPKNRTQGAATAKSRVKPGAKPAYKADSKDSGKTRFKAKPGQDAGKKTSYKKEGTPKSLSSTKRPAATYGKKSNPGPSFKSKATKNGPRL